MEKSPVFTKTLVIETKIIYTIGIVLRILIMILEKETLEKYGKIYLECGPTRKIICQCDYCSKIFERQKHILERTKASPTHSCGNKECTVKKRQDSMIALTGVSNAMYLEDSKNKIKKTCMETYGVENPFQSEEIKEKIKKTHIENLGVEHPSKSEEIKEKKKETWTKTLGVDNPQKSQIVQEKTFETNEKKYGTKCVFQSEEIKTKIKATNMINLKVENPSQSPIVQKKREETFLRIYNVKNPFLSEEIQKKIYDNNMRKYNQPRPPRNYKSENEIREWLNSFGFDFRSRWDIITNEKGRAVQLDMFVAYIGIQICLRLPEEKIPIMKNILNVLKKILD